MVDIEYVVRDTTENAAWAPGLGEKRQSIKLGFLITLFCTATYIAADPQYSRLRFGI